MDIPPSGSKPDWNKEKTALPERDPPEAPVTPRSTPEHSPETLPFDSTLSERRVTRSLPPEQAGPGHLWDNREPLVRMPPVSSENPPVPRGWRASWGFQRDFSELALRPDIKKEALRYIQLDTDQRERWLNERMVAERYNGSEFPALSGQMEIRANRDIKAFEILGHYAGEVHTEKTLSKLKETYGSTAVSEYLVEARSGYCVSAIEHGNVCSLINANQLHVDQLDPNNPAVKELDKTVVPDNTALMPVSYQGTIITFVVSIKPIPKGESLWLDYGANYWIDRFGRKPLNDGQPQDDDFIPHDSAREDESDVEWQPDPVEEPMSSDENASSDEEPPPTKKARVQDTRPHRPVATTGSLAICPPLIPEQQAMTIDRPFDEQNYQLKVRDKKILLCNRHDVAAGQILGEVKGRACYVTLLPSGKVVTFQDWYGKPVLMDNSKPVVLFDALTHLPTASGKYPVYQGVVLEGCHRLLSCSNTGSNCEVELYSPDHSEFGTPPRDESVPVLGKDVFLRLVSTRNIPAGTPLARPSELVPAFTASTVDSEDDKKALEEVCRLAMTGLLTEPLPKLWNQEEFPSLKSLTGTLPETGGEVPVLVNALERNPEDTSAITRLLEKTEFNQELIPLFILASLKHYTPENRVSLALIAKRLKHKKIPHPVTKRCDWTSADVFQIAEEKSLIPGNLRFKYMPGQWLRSACLAGRWLELAGYFQYLLDSGCPSTNVPMIFGRNGIPVPDFLEPKAGWNINNLNQFIQAFGVRIPSNALKQRDKWQPKRLSGNRGVIDAVLENISQSKSLVDVRQFLKRRNFSVYLPKEAVCPPDIGELITMFKTEEAISDDEKARFFSWLDEELLEAVGEKMSCRPLNSNMRARLNKDLLLHFLYARARHGVTVRKTLDQLKRSQIPQPVGEGAMTRDNQWDNVGQDGFFQYLADQGEFGKTIAREFFKTQTDVSKRKLVVKHPWLVES